MPSVSQKQALDVCDGRGGGSLMNIVVVVKTLSY